MSLRTDVLLWAQRILNKPPGAKPYLYLEIRPDAGQDEAQAAFHKVARMAHPDLHRASVTPEELEMITLAYAKVAGAYADFRSQRGPAIGGPIGGASPTTPPRPQTPTGIGVSAIPGAAVPPANVAPTNPLGMNSKALLCYRKAELALRRGDLRGAILQLKMAIAADPQNQGLRKALAEVEAEVGKNA